MPDDTSNACFNDFTGNGVQIASFSNDFADCRTNWTQSAKQVHPWYDIRPLVLTQL